jgi:SOS regulatory protein LexA
MQKAKMEKDRGVRILGLVEAGFPTPASEELIDTMSLDEYLIENREATYLLKVKGDSMIEAGIMPGDLVLVERGRTAKPGDIVVAEVDGEYALKYLRKKGREHYLESANSKYKDIYPKEELKIEAVLRAVIRKYG